MKNDKQLTPAWGIGKAMVAAMSDAKKMMNCILRDANALKECLEVSD